MLIMYSTSARLSGQEYIRKEVNAALGHGTAALGIVATHWLSQRGGHYTDKWFLLDCTQQ